MTYYKIIVDNEIVSTATEEGMCAYNPVNSMLLPSGIIQGQFIRANNILYRDSTWMLLTLPPRHYEYIEAQVVSISEEEYNSYQKIFETVHEPITYAPEPEPEVEVIAEPDITLEQARELKIKEFSILCNKNIEQGFDFMGSHYSMTTQDQLNLLSAQVELINGALTVRYHADGEQYRDIPASEMAFIIEEAFIHKDTELRYFEQMKQLINGMENIVDILNVQYEG